MARLTWDKPEERRFHSGIDAGVLYPPDRGGVVWNGISSVNESADQGIVTPVYFDGVKINSYLSSADYTADLGAYTYPDEFERFAGYLEHDHGILIDGQPSGSFGLSYRTKTESGVRIHVLYNLVATISDKAYTSVTNQVNPLEIRWNISGTPEYVEGFRPTEHYILEPDKMAAEIWSFFDGYLYGADNLEPQLLPAGEFAHIANNWNPQIIDDQESGFAELSNGMGDLVEGRRSGLYRVIPGGRLKPTLPKGLYVVKDQEIIEVPDVWDGGIVGTPYDKFANAESTNEVRTIVVDAGTL